MKKLIQAILMAVFMILLVIPQAVQAQEYSSEQDYYQAVQDNQRVYDFAELLSDSERENIEEKISDASEQSGLDIVVLTVNQMFGKTDREMADDFYDNGQFGFELEGKEDSGILLLIDMENRQLYISTAGTGIDYVTDDDWKEILNDIRDYATDGDYVQVCETYIDDVIFYAKWANSTFFTMFQSLTVDLIIGVVIAGIVVLVLRFSGKSEKTVSLETVFSDSPENQKRRFPGKLTVLRAVSSWHPKRIALSAGQLLHGKLSRTHRAAAAVPYINRAAARRMAAAEPDFKTDLPGVGRDLRHPAMPEPESLSCRQELHLNVWHWHHNIRVTAEWRKLCQKRRTRL